MNRTMIVPVSVLIIFGISVMIMTMSKPIYGTIFALSSLIIIGGIVVYVTKQKILQGHHKFLEEYNTTLSSIAKTPVSEAQLSVEKMLADPAMFTVVLEESLPDKYAERLSPLMCSFFSRYAHVKNLLLDYELSPTFQEEPAQPGLLLIGKDVENKALIYVVESGDEIRVRGDGNDYSIDFSTVYHFIYAQERIRQLFPA